MPVFSPGTDKLITFLVRFVCGVLIGTGIWMYQNWKDFLGDMAVGATKSIFWSWLLWSGVIGLIFGLTSAKSDGDWLDS